jgi:hypothetical protein
LLSTLDGIRPAPPVARADKPADTPVAAEVRLPLAQGLKTAAIVGFTISLRSAGLLVLPLAAVGLLATLLNVHAEHRHVRWPSGERASVPPSVPHCIRTPHLTGARPG